MASALATVEDAFFVDLIRQIRQSDGGEKLSDQALLMVAFLATDFQRERAENVDRKFARLVSDAASRGGDPAARRRPDSDRHSGIR
jgi:hypothetical protein